MFSERPDQKNLLLAIVLSMGILLLWQWLYAAPKMKEEQERQARLKQQQQSQTVPAVEAVPGVQTAPGVPVVATPGQTTPGPGQTTAPTASTPVAPPATLTRADAIKATPRVAIETPSLLGSISLRGGRIDDLSLAKYRDSVDRTSPNVVLFTPSGAPNAYYAEKGWAAAGSLAEAMPNSSTVWTAETKGPLTPTSPVVMSWDNGKGLLFRRTVKVDENYLFTITDEVENKTGADVTLFPFGVIARHGVPKIEGYFISHEGLIGVLGEKGLTEIAYSELTGEIDKNQKRSASAVTATREFKALREGWLGITDKYWAAALIPNQKTEYDARLWAWRAPNPPGSKDAFKDHFQADFRQPAVTIAAGSKGSADTLLFAGAKEVHIVDGYKAAMGIKQFESIIDWGTFWYFTKPLYHLLDWINSIVKNFGVAILIVTVLVKLVFFPLANKSYESMAKMKKLQPEMEKIRDRYKDDKARQQQEMMALYQKEKINPLAGCLPILIQIPVFFALYKVLFVLIDLRHAPFFGWIQDLSAPDPTSLFNLFGLLPIPALEHYLLGYTIGAWAIVMGITMWLQMQLNPQQPDPMQQAIFNWMPVMFTIMLGGFASGLVIYWAWSNALSIAQQWLIMKKHNVDIPLMDNLKKTFGPIVGMVGRKK
jgi:YidC/Oxa1 family membrane protein insertase